MAHRDNFTMLTTKLSVFRHTRWNLGQRVRQCCSCGRLRVQLGLGDVAHQHCGGDCLWGSAARRVPSASDLRSDTATQLPAGQSVYTVITPSKKHTFFAPKMTSKVGVHLFLGGYNFLRVCIAILCPKKWGADASCIQVSGCVYSVVFRKPHHLGSNNLHKFIPVKNSTKVKWKNVSVICSKNVTLGEKIHAWKPSLLQKEKCFLNFI